MGPDWESTELWAKEGSYHVLLLKHKTRAESEPGQGQVLRVKGKFLLV